MDALRQSKFVTLYLKPFDLEFFKSTKDLKELGGWIKAKIVEEYGSFDKLDMHVSLVLDDAHSPDGYFESGYPLRVLYEELEQFMNKVRIVIVGARFWRESGRREGEATYLEPLSRYGLQCLGERNFQFDEIVVDSLIRRPILKALTADARSAWLLFNSVKAVYPIDESDQSNWLNNLLHSAPDLAMPVIESYTLLTGLKYLDDAGRRRVAAWVLHKVEAVKDIRNFRGGLFEFEGLMDEVEAEVAFSLVWLNVKYYADSLCGVRGKREAVEVSPAMEIALLSVLFGMSNVVAYHEASAEQGTSLDNLRQAVVSAVDPYFDDFSKSPQVAHDELDQRLNKLLSFFDGLDARGLDPKKVAAPSELKGP
jgi:hypothetical protein